MKLSAFLSYRFHAQLAALVVTAGITSAALTGCGMNGAANSATGTGITANSSATMQGHVHGGAQGVSGATIQLYAAGVPAAGGGYGQASTPLLTSTVTTDQYGSFSITGKYTCPTPAVPVYIVATGGNPGLTPTAPATTVNNTGITLMAALGTCPAGGNLLATVPSIDINEITTVAAVWALQQFMAAPAAANHLAPAIGAPATAYATGTSVGGVQTAVIGLNNAFTTARVMADVSLGATPNTNFAYATPESAKINTIADILSSCVNSDPSQSTNCSALFSAATPTGKTTATDTAQAAWYMAQNPINNVGGLYTLIPPTPPYQPTYLAPMTLNTTNSGPATNAFNDTTIAINYAPVTAAAAFAVNAPYSIAIDAYGNAWVTNTNSISELGADGSALIAPTNTFTPSTANGSYSQFTTPPTGARTVSAPKAIAVDLNNRAWFANYDTVGTPSGSDVGVFSNPATFTTSGGSAGTGTAVPTTTGFYVGNLPWGVAIDGSNNVFVTNTATAGAAIIDGRSLAKLAAADGTYSYSTSTTTTDATGSYTLPGGQALVAVDTNASTGGTTWVSNYNSCKVQGQFNGSTPFGAIGMYNSSLAPLADSDAITALSNATVGVGSTANCNSTSIYVGQTVAAGIANPFGIAIDRNNGVWLSDVFTSSLGFDGLTYLTAPAATAGLIPSSYYLVNGVQPTATAAGVGGTTLTKAGGVIVDGNNNVWVANQTAKSIVEATFNGSAITLLTPGQGSAYGTTGANYGIGFAHNTGTSTGIAVDPSGNVWVTNASSSTYTNQAAGTTALSNSVTVLVGAAGPVITPLSLSIKSAKLGTKP